MKITMLSIANVVGIFDLIGEHGGDDFYVSTLHSIRPLKKKKKQGRRAPVNRQNGAMATL